MFHAGTNARPGGSYHTNGGRVLTVVGRGVDLAAARALAEAAADEIAWPGMQRRRDIAADPPSNPDTPDTPDGQSVVAPAGAAR